MKKYISRAKFVTRGFVTEKDMKTLHQNSATYQWIWFLTAKLGKTVNPQLQPPRERNGSNKGKRKQQKPGHNWTPHAPPNHIHKTTPFLLLLIPLTATIAQIHWPFRKRFFTARAISNTPTKQNWVANWILELWDRSTWAGSNEGNSTLTPRAQKRSKDVTGKIKKDPLHSTAQHSPAQPCKATLFLAALAEKWEKSSPCYSTQLYSILPYSTLLYSILFYSILIPFFSLCTTHTLPTSQSSIVILWGIRRGGWNFVTEK